MADITDITPDLFNLELYEVTIIGKNGEIYQIWPDFSKFSYGSLSITEGMFEASVQGQLTIRDLRSTAEQINFTGFEDLIIRFENPGVPGSYKSLRFKIYNVQSSKNQMDGIVFDEDTNIPKIMLTVQFISYEHYLLNHKHFSELATGSTGSDIITKIATDSRFGKRDTTNVGLVNSIEQRYFKTGKSAGTTQKRMFIEPTKNWIWYKQNQLMYPWSKLNRPIKPLQLMQFLAEYSVAENNPYVCNFLFWQDLDRWNFRSIESLINEIQPYREYSFSIAETLDLGYISDLRILNESNFLRLLESNALASKYQLVEPKWDQPYREYLDYNESHSITEITYDYFRDYNKWSKVEKYPLLESHISTVPTVVNTIQDNVSGYFSPNYSNREKTVSWEHHGYTHGNREGSNTWQPMFDQINLSGATCAIIQKEIKQKIKDKKIEYAHKKNLKEKWRVYRCSICCDYNFLDTDQDTIFTQEYKVVSAGGFSDLVDYKSSGFTLGINQIPTFPDGLTLSYDFGITGPFSKTIGELMYLRETPDIQTKYLYDLELKRIDIAEDVLRNSIKRLQAGKAIAENYPLCSQIENPQTELPLSDNYCNPLPGPEGIQGGGVFPCFCTNGFRNDYIKNTYTDPITNREQLLNSPYFQSMRDIIEIEKTRFAAVYEEYRTRKAFFISKEVGFTANSAPLNLFNVKSINRIPIRGSKYEKLAHKEVLRELVSGLSGATANFKGFAAGVTSYYPYDIFYDNDTSISPKVKHPYYDSGYNFDVGSGANAFFSAFDPIGGPDAGAAGNPIGVFQYFVSFQAKVKTITDTVEHRKEPLPIGFVCVPKITNVTKEEYKNFTQKDFVVENLEPNKLIKRILDNEVSSINLGGASSSEIIFSGNSVVVSLIYISTCDDIQLDRTTYTITCDITETYSDNKNSTQLPAGICVVQPFGLERIPDFDPIEYLNSRNFTNIQEPDVGDEAKRPIENILEELESFVRVEFNRPIGANTLYDFPKGFYDTPGSEYYLPYHVMLTAGPFGAKSADYNISVLGQDPYGFDVAVKRIDKKKQNLKPENKALVNNTDYHTVTSGYLKGINTGSSNNSSTLLNNINDQSYALWQSDFPVSYGENASIGNNKVTNFGALGFSNSRSFIDTFYSNQLNSEDSDQTSIVRDDVGNVKAYTPNISRSFYYGNISELFYHDLIKRATRINPLALPNSYFEFNNMRPFGAIHQTTNFSGTYEGTWITKPYRSTTTVTSSDPSKNGSSSFTDPIVKDDILNLLVPGNVFMYVQTPAAEALPIDTSYFKSNVSYNPGAERKSTWGAFFEVDVRNRNIRIEPEDETTFFGYYYGVSAWKHPATPTALLSTEMQKAIWKNDISGETEYGMIGPELDEEFSTFDRNFAAQFIVMSRHDAYDPCPGYPCANPIPPDNSNCPPTDPLCGCPCQELRPDKMLTGITGAEPTYTELTQLEKDIKECDLIEKVLGEDWLGCVWGDPKSTLNCSCPCLGKHFLDYLKYSQTYCTFWQTPPERPLLRNAQMMQILSNKIMITVLGDFTLRPGNIVKINLPGKRYHGYWLVSTINHDIAKTKHLMSVILIRDSESLDPNVRSKNLVLNTNNDYTLTSTATSYASAEKKQNNVRGGAGAD